MVFDFYIIYILFFSPLCVPPSVASLFEFKMLGRHVLSTSCKKRLCFIKGEAKKDGTQRESNEEKTVIFIRKKEGQERKCSSAFPLFIFIYL